MDNSPENPRRKPAGHKKARREVRTSKPVGPPSRTPREAREYIESANRAQVRPVDYDPVKLDEEPSLVEDINDRRFYVGTGARLVIALAVVLAAVPSGLVLGGFAGAGVMVSGFSIAAIIILNSKEGALEVARGVREWLANKNSKAK